MSTIPLLPPPVRSVRDAAGSAGRLIRKGMQRITEKTLDLVLDLPEFTATYFEFKTRGEQNILHLYCEHQHELPYVPVVERFRVAATRASHAVYATWILVNGGYSSTSLVGVSIVRNVAVRSLSNWRALIPAVGKHGGLSNTSTNVV